MDKTKKMVFVKKNDFFFCYAKARLIPLKQGLTKKTNLSFLSYLGKNVQNAALYQQQKTKKGEKKDRFVFFAVFGGKKGLFRGPKFDFKY